MMHVSVDEALEQLPVLLAAADRGEDVRIASHDGTKEYQIVVVATEQPRERRKGGSLRGKIWMSDDFDDPLPEFEEYLR